MEITLSELFSQIADELRVKLETEGKITASDFPNKIAEISKGIDTSDATATAEDIAKDKTAYVNGEKVVGKLEVSDSQGIIKALIGGVTTSKDMPTQKTKYWLKKGKNFFNKNSEIVDGKFFGSDGTMGEDESLFCQETYIPVTPSTTYSISAATWQYFRIVEYDIGKNFIQRVLGENRDKYTASDGSFPYYSFTTSLNCQYIRISCNISNLDNIQLEKGTKSTPYEEYIEPKIYVLNENDEYEEYLG